jgi:hypothetical protein
MMEVFVFWGFVVRCKADWIQIVRLWYIALIIQNSGFYAFQITEILLDPGEPILKTTHKGKVHQFTVAISFLSGKIGVAGAAGDRAAWICECGYVTPLVGRCGGILRRHRYTICPRCSRKYRVYGSPFRRTRSVEEIPQER